ALDGAAPGRHAGVALALFDLCGDPDLPLLRPVDLAYSRLGDCRAVDSVRAGPGLGGPAPQDRVVGCPLEANRASLADRPWRTRSSRVVYQNPWIRVDEDQAELPDGRTTVYGVVRCGECVGVLPFLDAETVVLIRQYRYVARGIYWEMPTGGVHSG